MPALELVVEAGRGMLGFDGMRQASLGTSVAASASCGGGHTPFLHDVSLLGLGTLCLAGAVYVVAHRRSHKTSRASSEIRNLRPVSYQVSGLFEFDEMQSAHLDSCTVAWQCTR